MTATQTHPNIVQRNIQRMVATAWAARALAQFLHLVDRPIFEWSGGRTTLTSLVTGLPIITLTTTGAKSGAARTVPLVALIDGPKLIVIASNFGQAHHPGWYFNLRKNPQAMVTLDHVARSYTAHAAAGPEYDCYWARAVKLYAGYAAYKGRAGDRRIPIMVLTPDGGLSN
jgi:deazaflavin-dependent oxidoreductase (nitroreductase family)